MNRCDAAMMLLGAMVAFGVAPRIALAQATGRMCRIGYLSQPNRAPVLQCADQVIQ